MFYSATLELSNMVTEGHPISSKLQGKNITEHGRKSNQTHIYNVLAHLIVVENGC